VLSGEPVLRVRGLSKRFSDTVAVHPLDLDIGAAEYFCILGPSGSGKTTLLRLLAGFERPDSGEIRLGGERVDALPPERRDANTVFQGYALFPHLSVFENVAFGPRMKGARGDALRESVGTSLALVGLEGYGGRFPATLSGGEQQRVALARALINRPRVLFLDEPLAALDRKLRARMQGELARIQRESGVAFVHVTHDQEEALRLADRVAVMQAGRFVQVGAPGEVYDRPASAFVADFLGSANLVRARAEGETVVLADVLRLPPGSWPVELVRPGGGWLAIRPEALALGRPDDPPPAPGMLRLAATVVAAKRVGPVTEVETRTGSMRLVVHDRRPFGPATPAPGDEVQLFLRTEDLVLLEDSPSGEPRAPRTE
jgi:spermidine/putrescine transport system ATP-binding protein